MYHLISQSLLPPLAPRFGHLDVFFVSGVIRLGFPRVRKIKMPVNQPMHAFKYKKRRGCHHLSDKTSQSSSLIASVAEECLALSGINLAALFCNNRTLAINVLLSLSPHTISL